MKKFILVMFALILTGCVTYVPIKSVKMPTIDTNNIQRLAIKQFENKSGVGGPLGAQLSLYLTEKSTQLITSTGKFTIVAPTDPNADGVFSGEIRIIDSKDSRERREIKDKNGKIRIEITYKREVSLEFSYSVISTRTDMPVGTVLKQGSTGDTNQESYAKLADTLTLAKRIVDSEMNRLRQDIVPVIVSVNRSLMNETSTDKVVKQLMKEALALVKNGNYSEAIRQYDEIYSEYGSTAAMTNANILRESVESDTSARARLNQLYNDTSGMADRAVKNAVDTLNSKLPAGINIMIMKTRSSERNMIDYVADQMIKTVVQDGRFKVVDRSNQALIDAEQEFQLSGNVSDDSTVLIGRQLGVKYAVLCWISGEKSLRRLNLKILNIETAQITHQTDFEI